METRRHKLPPANVAIGAVFLALGLGLNPWTIGRLLQSRDATIWLDTKILILSFELFCVVVGLLALFKAKTGEQRKRFVFGLAAFALMLVAVELGLHAGLFALGLFRAKQDVPDDKCLLSCYRDKLWAKTLFNELLEQSEEYVPFLEWDRKPYRGKYTNVDSHGVRKTWNPNGFSRPPRRVYMFGGSTLWGSGARDDYTIPSHLSKLLNGAGYAFIVRNYGEAGYTFTQEIIQLVLLLRDGHRPDYVIFYDGANDVYAAYQSGIPGAPQNLYTFKAKLRKWSNVELIWLGLVRTIKERSMLYQAVRKAAVLLSPRQAFRERASRYDRRRLAALCAGIVEQYRKSADLLCNLAKAYGFKYLCVWQPVAFTEERLTLEELGTDPRLRDGSLAWLYREAHRRLLAKPPPNFVDLSDALKGRRQPCYTDFCHLCEEGNALVATRIFDVLSRKFPLR